VRCGTKRRRAQCWPEASRAITGAAAPAVVEVPSPTSGAVEAVLDKIANRIPRMLARLAALVDPDDASALRPLHAVDGLAGHAAAPSDLGCPNESASVVYRSESTSLWNQHPPVAAP
jgi:hypothetical protein